eukprot:m.264850 g.264850  ORF g.264850 m.264850 type:complete len:483 (-) comp17625_c0_seq11:76-1524(-)
MALKLPARAHLCNVVQCEFLTTTMATPAKSEFQAVVMAGGLGSRMFPLTAKRKALLPVGNIPLIAYALDILERAQFSHAIVVARRSAANEILTLVQAVLKLKLQVHMHTVDDDIEYGTADVLRELDDVIKSDFVVLSCDTISNVPLHRIADIHRSRAAGLTCLLAQLPARTTEERHAERKRLKQFEDNKGLTDFIGLEPGTDRVMYRSSEADLVDTEAMRLRRHTLRHHPQIVLRNDLLDAHVYIFARWVLDYLKVKDQISTIRGELVPDLVHKQFSKPKAEEPNDIFNFLPVAPVDATRRLGLSQESVKEFGCYAYVVPSHGITKPHEDPKAYFIARANTTTNYADLNHAVPKHFDTLYPIQGATPMAVDPNAVTDAAQFGPECIIGTGTEVGKSTLKRSIIGCHIKIGDKCKISGCVILDHVTIEDGAVLTNCLISSNATIGAKCSLSNCRVASDYEIKAESKATNEAFDARVFDSASFL